MNYEATLQELVLADDKYIVMTAENRAAIRNLPGVLNGRFLDTGITEQAMIGMAAGLALRGRVPVAHALAAFLTMRAFEFVRTDAGIGRLPVKLVGGVPGFLSDANGPTHQAIEDISLMRGIPGMQIFCPADEAELVLGLPSFLASPHPVYIRHNTLPAAAAHNPNFAIGQAEQVQNGRDVTILVYGMLFREALAASELLEAQGISARLLNMRTVWPVDETAVLAAAKQTKLLVTIEDHFLTGGLFSIVSELLVRRGVQANVLPIALENRWFQPALLDEVLAYEGFTGPQLAQKIHEYYLSTDFADKNKSV
ncbi:MAG: transketolase [Ardenticatenaceae bacterium]|nr:transketolase [Ardenticatenaceae bacterium]